MKIIITTILIITSWLGFAQNEVELDGNFNGQRCNGSVGLCTISQIAGYDRNPTNISLIAKKIDEYNFQLIIDRSKLSSTEELKIVGKELSSLEPSTYYILEEDMVLDSQIVNAIGLKENYHIIPKGKYVMKIDASKVYINFKVEKL